MVLEAAKSRKNAVKIYHRQDSGFALWLKFQAVSKADKMKTYFPLKSGVILASAIALIGCSAAADHSGAEHSGHAHAHAGDCGHVAVVHGDHTDYAHDGHLHHVHNDHADEHVIQVTEANPVVESPADASRHADHAHGANDTLHAQIPHGDHMDYLHDGHLHHLHDGHIDEHGKVASAG